LVYLVAPAMEAHCRFGSDRLLVAGVEATNSSSEKDELPSPLCFQRALPTFKGWWDINDEEG
jgi:hypothetical protein